MRTADFDYPLPAELIAQMPARRRDESRLMVLHRRTAKIEHRQFPNLLEYLRAGDVLVLNNSRVIPARLRGVNAKSGGEFEMLLLEENGVNDWWVMMRPGKRGRMGTRIMLRDLEGKLGTIEAAVTEVNEQGHRRVRFSGTTDISGDLQKLGEVPLPPYIQRVDLNQMKEDRERYQTVFARRDGSVAAPTAGLHFTQALLDRIAEQGVQVCFITLHVGLGTFAPVKSENLSEHTMHEERYELSEETATAINGARLTGRRIVAVGTTSVRVLESVGSKGRVVPGRGKTRIFIFPPYEFKIADALVTNFHLPRSTLLMLVSAFAAPNATGGREMVLSAYAEAIQKRYRFFSYGDAMLLL
jgi:S-adenosylmethionine:tRNA ribosyltransferase-isomerase